MIHVRGSESQLRSVRRPLWRARIAAHFKELAFFSAGDRHTPKVSLTNKDDLVAGGSEDGSAPLANWNYLSSAHIDQQNLLFCPGGIAGGVGNFARLGLTTPAHESNRPAL